MHISVLPLAWFGAEDAHTSAERGSQPWAKQVWLEVFPTNRLAIALYRSLDFRSRSRRKSYYRYAPQGRRDALAMAISLDY